MARDKVHKIHSLPGDSPWQGGLPPEGSPEHPFSIRAFDKVMSVQRPIVLAHLRSIRLRHPHASPAQIIMILERRYLAAVTTTGAAVGATAVVPGIGTTATLALSGVETAGFLEATALFAQSIAEVHGIRVADPDRARALVMTLMLGTEGLALLKQWAGQAEGNGVPRSGFWGETITKTLPRAAMGPLADKIKKEFIRQFAKRGGASILGKALPFGIGAVIGGGGNHILGRRVVVAARKAFGPAPALIPSEIEPRMGARRLEHIVGGFASNTARSVGDGAKSASASVKHALTRRSAQHKLTDETRSLNDEAIERAQTPSPDAPTR